MRNGRVVKGAFVVVAIAGWLAATLAFAQAPLKIGAMIPLTGGGATVGRIRPDRRRARGEEHQRRGRHCGPQGATGHRGLPDRGDRRRERGQAARVPGEGRSHDRTDLQPGHARRPADPERGEDRVGERQRLREADARRRSVRLQHAGQRGSAVEADGRSCGSRDEDPVGSDPVGYRCAGEDRGRGDQGGARRAQHQARRRPGVPVSSGRHDAAAARAAARQSRTSSCCSRATARTPATW